MQAKQVPIMLLIEPPQMNVGFGRSSPSYSDYTAFLGFKQPSEMVSEAFGTLEKEITSESQNTERKEAEDTTEGKKTSEKDGQQYSNFHIKA